MELANPSETDHASQLVRVATKADADSIFWLLKTAPHNHVHVDWHLPIDWIGSPGFVVLADTSSSTSDYASSADKLYTPKPAPLRACLAVAADPPPAAWIRVLSIAAIENPFVALESMLARVVDHLRESQLNEIGWLASDRWPVTWLKDLGFQLVNQIETYVKPDMSAPAQTTVPGLGFRPVELEDMPALAKLEDAAFEPLWRHSAEGLALARYQAIDFEVAILQDKVVGFQLSTRSDVSAHLVRLTVDPDFHGIGIGSALLARAIAKYRRAGLHQVSLNTQVDNYASQYLYRKFGFHANGQRLPVWSFAL
jgi:ribosomal protein S18 acetylase RimI-like enzyme